MEKRRIAAFDFDGTLTKKDTLIEFIRFTHGSFRLYLGILFISPFIIASKFKIYNSGKAKQRMFSLFYKKMPYSKFNELGERFATNIEYFFRSEVLDNAHKHIQKGHTVYVITASIEEWVKPWCNNHNLNNIIATRIEIDSKGLLSGKFITPNCTGKEKINKLLEIEPQRSEYILYAYGDSNGDKELFSISDFHKKITV